MPTIFNALQPCPPSVKEVQVKDRRLAGVETTLDPY